MTHSDQLPTAREAPRTRRSLDGRPGLRRGIGVTLMLIGVLWLTAGIAQPWTVWGVPKTVAGMLWSCHAVTASTGRPVDRCWVIGSDYIGIARVDVPSSAGTKLDGTHAVEPNPAYARRSGWVGLSAAIFGVAVLAQGASLLKARSAQAPA